MSLSNNAMPEADSAPVHEALGQSDVFLAFQERLSRVAKVDRPVLLVGERGTGKELAASRIHYLSPRWKEPFVTLNCATLSPALIESELFGHEAGAFTGARGRRTGRFEAADNGTLFLDELGAVPLEVQEKILRVVEYGTFERVGGSQPVHVDVRIVGATNADLPALAAQGRFKQDLLDRLSFEVLFLPPLRERREDIMLLVQHFAARMAAELGLAGAPEFSEGAVAALENYSWPGNVRELKNVVERAVHRSEGEAVTEIVIDPFESPFAGVEESAEAPASEESVKLPAFSSRPLKEAVEELERSLVRDALLRANYNQKKAATLLGLTYDQFRGYYRKHMNQER
jgi:psp operon transcriptional activator